MAANLTPEQLTKAEELANWDFIKDVSDVKEFRDHLARFPSGVTFRMARTKLDALAWTDLGATPGRTALEGYLAEFPDGAFAANAKAVVAEQIAAAAAAKAETERTAADAKFLAERNAREAAAWDAVKNTADAGTLDAFIKDWPTGRHVAEARRLRRAMGGNWLRNVLYSLAIAALAGFLMLGPTVLDSVVDTDSEYVIGRGMAVATVAGDVAHSSSSESLRSCRNKCSANPKCNAFEFLERTSGCYQLNRVISIYRHGGHSTGVKRGSSYVSLLPK